MTAETAGTAGAPAAGIAERDGAGGGVQATGPTQVGPLRWYHPHLRPTWWLANRRYVLFVLRELTAIPIVLWLASLLLEVWRLRNGPGGYYAYNSPTYVAFSVVCLVFALLHSVTWLNLSGVILRVKLGPRSATPVQVIAANYAQWVLASIGIGALLVLLAIWLG